MWYKIMSLVFVGLFWTASVFGASTSAYVEHEGGSTYQLTITITCAAGSAVFTSTKIPYDFRGMVLTHVRTYPGGTAPTDASDLYIYQHSSSGKDILDGSGVDKIDATSTLTFKAYTGGSPSSVPVTGDLYTFIENNAVDAAIAVVELHFVKIKE